MATDFGSCIGSVVTWNVTQSYGAVNCVDGDVGGFVRVPILKDDFLKFAALLEAAGHCTKANGLRVSFHVHVSEHGAPKATSLKLAPWEALEVAVIGITGSELCHVTISKLDVPVNELKREIQQLTRIPCAAQSLSLGGVELQDHSRFVSHDSLLRREKQIMLVRLDLASGPLDVLENIHADADDRVGALQEVLELLENGVLDKDKFDTTASRVLSEEGLDEQLLMELLQALQQPERVGFGCFQELKNIAALGEADDDGLGPSTAAIQALAELEPQSAAAALEELLRDGLEGYAGGRALEELGRIDAAKALEIAMGKAVGSDESMRLAAVQVLKTIADPSAAPVLQEVLEQEGMGYIAGLAAEALGELGASAAAPLLIRELQSAIQEARENPVVMGGTATPPKCIPLARALGRLGDQAAVPALEACLVDFGFFDHILYVTVAKALSQLGHASGFQTLLLVPKLPNQEGTTVLLDVAEALGEIGGEDAEAELQRLLEFEEHEVYPFHLEVAKALAKLGNSRGISLLIEAVKGRDEDRACQAMNALDELGTLEAQKALREASEERSRLDALGESQ